MSREHSAIIKGIGILFMMLCHLSHLVGVERLNNDFYHMLANASHMINYCLIISGYGLYLVYNKNRLTWPYLLKRTLRLYLSLWIVLLIFPVILGSLLYPGRFHYNWYMILTNFSGWRWDYCQFTWFLLPYVLMTFCAKTVFKLMDRIGNVMSFVFGALLYAISTWLISRYYTSWLCHHYLVYHIVLLAQTLLGLIIGAIMARQTLSGKSMKIPWFNGRSWLVALLFIVLYFLRGQIHSAALNPFFAIIVVIAVVNIEWPSTVSKLLSSLGDKLMMMWFVQGFVGAMMFTEYYQPLRWAVLILLAWILVTYLVASVLQPITVKLSRVLKLA